MWQLIFISAALVVSLFLIIVQSRPSDFRITRAARIAAPVDVVFENVNDLHKWEAWSPWAKLDPNAKSTFSGPVAGPGASMVWDGNNKVGAGKMTITDSHPGESLRMNLEFLRPFKAHNLAEFTFKAEGDQTIVTWSMAGKNNFICKAMGLFINCDKMVGGEFEKGLANLNSVTQQALAKK